MSQMTDNHSLGSRRMQECRHAPFVTMKWRVDGSRNAMMTDAR